MKPRIYFRIIITLSVFIFLLLSQPLTQAATTPMEVKDAVYDMDTVSPYKTYFKNQSESVDMETGNLNLRVTDLTLPGRGGLDFNLTRLYSSNNGAWFIPGYTFYEDSMSFEGKVTDTTYLDKKYGLGVGWAFDFPSVEKGEYLHLGGGVYRIAPGKSPSNLEKYYIQDICYLPQTGSVDGLSYSSFLKKKEGLTYYFDSGGNLVLMKDQFGNRILINYTTINGQPRYSQITDSVGRVISFSYSTNKITISVGEISVEYTLNLVYHGTVAGVDSYKYVLDTVSYKSIGGAEPGDRIIKYEYQHVTGDFIFWGPTLEYNSMLYGNHFSNLVQITHPGGRVSKYEYELYENRLEEYLNTSDIDAHIQKYRLIRRADVVNNQESQISEFNYYNTDLAAKYNQRRYIPAPWDTQSQAKSLTEKYYFNRDHLLIKKESTGERFKQTENTYYNYYTKRPYCQELLQFDSGGASSVSTRKCFDYDIYGDLLTERVETTENGAKKIWSETTNIYDQAHYHALQESRQTIDSQKSLNTCRTIDTYGRAIWEDKILAQKSGVQATSCSSPNTPVYYYPAGSTWSWVTPIKVNRITLSVYWFAAAPWQYANYTVRVRRYNEGTVVVSQSHEGQGGMFASGYDTNNWDFTLPENDYYVLELLTDTMGHFGSCVQGTNIKGYGTEDFFSCLESYSSSFQYDPVYKANLTKSSFGKYTTNYEYDSVNHAYLKKIYVSGVNNPDYGTSNETVKVEFGYDSLGRRTSYKDGLDHEKTYLYDKWNRVIEENNLSDGAKKTIHYYDSQNKVEVIDEKNIKTIYQYDGLSRLTGTFGILNGSETKLSGKVYNSLGQLWQDTDGDNNTTYYYYDAGGRPWQTRYPDGNSQYTTFDDYNRTKFVTDTNRVETITLFDPLGNPLRVMNGAQTLAAYEYDRRSQVIKFTDGNGQITEYDQGIWGVKGERYKKADGSQSQLSNILYDYDDLGNVITKWWGTDPRDPCNYTAYYYDEAGRLIKKMYFGSSSYVKYRYDLASNLKEAVNHYQGVEAYDVTTSYNYTSRNRLDNYTQNINGRSYLVDYNYLANGQVDNITYPGSGTQVVYGYDTMGRVTTIRNNSAYYIGSATAPGVTYHNTGFMSKLEFGNGLAEEFIPDNRNRVDLLKLYPKNAPNNLQLNLDYSYDGEGNVRAMGLDSFTYDSQNRLKTALVNNQTTTYNLDPMGNRLSVTCTNGESQSYTPATDHNLLTFATSAGNFTYDSLGNLVSQNNGNNVTYYYDEENRLSKVVKNGAPSASYWYDATGNRVQATEAGETTQYIYDGLNVIQEVNLTTGVTSESFYLGKNKFAGKKNGELSYFHWDHLGSTRVITDASGNKVAEAKFKAFGEVDGSTGNLSANTQFTGKPFDVNVGLYYFGARWYNPVIGRFITQDPAKDGLNWYAYCNNNPLNAIDPNGQKPVQSNVLLGVAAHGYIEGIFMTEPGIPGHRGVEVPNALGFADIVYGVEVGEIKPSSYVNNLKGDAQLQKEIRGMDAFYGPGHITLDPAFSSEYFNYTMPVPGMNGWTLNVFTSPSHPGMIYYQYDDGQAEGTEQPSFSASFTIYGVYMENKLKALQDILGSAGISIPILEPGLVY